MAPPGRVLFFPSGSGEEGMAKGAGMTVVLFKRGVSSCHDCSFPSSHHLNFFPLCLVHQSYDQGCRYKVLKTGDSLARDCIFKLGLES